MVASEAARMCCQLLPPSCAMCSVASIDAIASSRSLDPFDPFYCTAPACDASTTLAGAWYGVGGKEVTYVTAGLSSAQPALARFP